jgi:hypothetical protein
LTFVNALLDKANDVTLAFQVTQICIGNVWSTNALDGD